MLTNSKVELAMMANHDSIQCSPACVPCFACIADKTNGGVATTDWRTVAIIAPAWRRCPS